MAKANTQTEELMRKAAERLDRSNELGQQLTLLPEGDLKPSASGRPGRGKGRAMSQMREWLAQRGFRLPEDVMAEMAGLTSNQDAVLTAMARAEQILSWAYDGAHIGKKAAPSPTPAMRLEAFKQVYALQLRAAEAMLPYGLAKVTPDVVQNVNATQIVMAAAPSQAAEGVKLARDVTPNGMKVGPPPMPHEMQQNQEVSAGNSDGSDANARTEGASD